MKIALTGGTGFVGRTLIKRLASDHELRCLARDIDAASLIEPESDVEWLAGDLGKDGWQNELVNGCDAVVHSGLYRTTKSFQGEEPDLVEYLRVNFLGTIKLIEAALAANVQRFIFVSTCAVHQKILNDRPLDEAHPLWAKNHYGAHKAAIEKFVHSFGLGGGFDICALRPTGIYGLATPVTQSKWYPLVRDIVEGKDVVVSGGGKEVHVEDVAGAIELLLTTRDSIAGDAFACYDRYISEHEVAMIAKELTDSQSGVVGEPRSPKHEIVTAKLRNRGMKFGGEALLRKTIEAMIAGISCR